MHQPDDKATSDRPPQTQKEGCSEKKKSYGLGGLGEGAPPKFVGAFIGLELDGKIREGDGGRAPEGSIQARTKESELPAPRPSLIFCPAQPPPLLKMQALMPLNPPGKVSFDPEPGPASLNTEPPVVMEAFPVGLLEIPTDIR